MPDDNTTTTTTTTTTEEGYFTGILDLYVAKMTSDDDATSCPTYDTPRILGRSIEVTITPQYREGTLYASNRLVRAKKCIDHYDLKFNGDVISPANYAYIYNRTVDTKGAQIIDGESDPAWLAVGMARTKDNGEKELWWLYRVKFAEPTISGKTDADKIEYQTPTVEGRADRRIHDNRLGIVIDSEDEGADATTVASWFSAVYEATMATTTP